MRRSSSDSTSSRKASTSSSSYPGLSRVVLNCLFRTSAGVSGMFVSLARLESPKDGIRSERLHEDDHDPDHDEEHREAEVERHVTQSYVRNETPQQLQWWLGDRISGLSQHQHHPRRVPGPRELAHGVQYRPADQEQEEEIQQCAQ